MVKVSVFYPNRPGSHFDMSYYCSKHIPMVQRLLGSTLKSVAVEEGIAGAVPGSPPTYLALGHLYFESIATHLFRRGGRRRKKLSATSPTTPIASQSSKSTW
jgi:uncharacterized protein (TIGR02118 family)